MKVEPVTGCGRGRVLSALAAGVLCLSASASHAMQVAYVPPVGTASTTVTADTYLIDWQPALRARVVTIMGARDATVSGTDTQRTLALDAPLSKPDVGGLADSCGGFPARRRDTTHLVVRQVSGGGRGISQIVEIGKVVTLDGCDAGREAAFDASADAGATVDRVAMDERPPMSDLGPGTRVAGLSELPWEIDGNSSMGVDIVQLYAGGQALFERSGAVVSAQPVAGGWLRFTFPTFERAYTRLSIDQRTGAETWLRAEWQGGQATRVFATLVVKVGDKAGFGGERRAARVWESGLFSRTPQRFYIALYEGGTGERISKDVNAGTESRSPIRWTLAGRNILQTRAIRGGTVTRTWVPLRNRDDDVRFVMESDFVVLDDGESGEFLAPRINFYIDTGKAKP